MSLLTLFGLVGVGVIILAYFLLQTGRDRPDSLRYLWLNLTGSCLIALSLIPEWNLPTFTIEVFWIAITLYGFWRRSKKAFDSSVKGQVGKKNEGNLNFPLASGPEQD